MSFNDIPEFRKALSRLTKEYPKLVRAGERSLLWVIVGWPNGCFIGEEEMANQAGLAISTKDTYMRSLTKLGFIRREQTYARKGLQQCYWVNVENMSNYKCLSPVIAMSNSELPTVDESLPITGEPKASDRLQAYKEYKEYKDYKDYKYETKRFNNLRPLLREELSNLQAGKNYEDALDDLDRKGATVEEVASFLNSQNLTNSHNVGGFVATLLRSYADSYRAIKPIAKPAWCSRCESPENRVEEFSYEIESFPAGARSMVCRACG